MAKSNSEAWTIGQRSETGFVRSENQDRMSWIRAPAADVFVVSDGMGGHAGGATAATLTVQVLQDELSAMDTLDHAAQRLERAIQAANETVYTRGQTGHPATAHMGATAVALLAAGGQIMLAHVGDSRAYLFNRRGTLQRLTRDHSVVQRLVDAGVLTETQAASHPDANVLERAIGLAPRVTVEVSDWLSLYEGEVCMLCSDGLCGYVGDDEIAAALREHEGPQEQADRLVKLALERGGEDNVTVQVLRYSEHGRAALRRWIGRGALALAAIALAIAAAALAGLGWFGSHTGHAPSDPKPASALAGIAPRFAGPAAPAAASASTQPSAALVTPQPSAALVTPRATLATEQMAPLEARIAGIERELREDGASRARNEQQLAVLGKRIDAIESRLAAAAAASAPQLPAAAHRPVAASAARKVATRATHGAAKDPAGIRAAMPDVSKAPNTASPPHAAAASASASEGSAAAGAMSTVPSHSTPAGAAASVTEAKP